MIMITGFTKLDIDFPHIPKNVKEEDFLKHIAELVFGEIKQINNPDVSKINYHNGFMKYVLTTIDRAEDELFTAYASSNQKNISLNIFL